ncbi:NAD(P)-binding domain-containing protein [Sphingopyxis sp.]|uniref:NAD(P)-binding domain-containing protein n=1 Tax=Sphingopyxis sp. TaxID=1908224 RepID=UPI0025CD3407|nr:NAD(P)-binding domain-containing protein [Sphingopyxis sp.]
MPFDTAALAYALPALPIWLSYWARHRAIERKSHTILEDARDAGLTEPNSLHPVIDTAKCIGCSACVLACPEGDVLGLLEGKATLIDPTRCIGHGACQQACPADALSLVFGTATRGIDIPFVSPDFETNVPGIYLAGEIGGMGLIRNAVKQGTEAVDAIAAANEADDADDMLDLMIVGAGPAGIAASLRAMELGLRFETVEQDSLGGTVAHFPRNKLIMTAPVKLPLFGELRFREIRKEALLGIWQDVIERTGLHIRCNERVVDITPGDRGFTVRTAHGVYRARRVLLAIGRRGTPRKLGVPGEERSNVVYRLTDPAQYAGRRVLVVGGGDSAIEAAVALADQPGTRVTLSYRRDAFNRTRRQNRDAIAAAAAAGRVTLYLQSSVEEVRLGAISLRHHAELLDLPNDDVIICAGGELSTGFLQSMGIRVERRFGTAASPVTIDPVNATKEANLQAA